jgi:hypothetical protein
MLCGWHSHKVSKTPLHRRFTDADERNCWHCVIGLVKATETFAVSYGMYPTSISNKILRRFVIPKQEICESASRADLRRRYSVPQFICNTCCGQRTIFCLIPYRPNLRHCYFILVPVVSGIFDQISVMFEFIFSSIEAQFVYGTQSKAVALFVKILYTKDLVLLVLSPTVPYCVGKRMKYNS